MSSNIAASTIRNLRPTANNRSVVAFDKCYSKIMPSGVDCRTCQPFGLAVLIFPISDVTAVKKPPGFDGGAEAGFGAGDWGAVLLLTVDFFAWRFRLPRDSGIVVPGGWGHGCAIVLSCRFFRLPSWLEKARQIVTAGANITQIYEVSTPEEARSICGIGVDHIGVLVGNGKFPRELALEAAANVAIAVVQPSKWSALFLTSDIALIETWARELQPDIVYLGAAPELLSLEDAATLKRNLPAMLLMRSIPVIGENSIDIARSYEGTADFLLLDSHRESDRQIGALGVTHD